MLSETVKHYDLEVDFFRRFLDPYMKYTSGLYEHEQEDLSSACVRMLDRIIELGGILPGCRILEIGPGWGSLLRRIQDRGIICEYVGVSPSTVQNTYIREFTDQKQHLVTSTFEQFKSHRKYDVIVLIGSFCHLKDKKRQLDKMKSMLAVGGRIVIEDTFFSSNAAYDAHKNNGATRFLQNDIFGFAEVLALSAQLEQIAEVGLKVVQMLEHSNSYRYTINSWLKTLKSLDTQQYPKAKDFIKYLLIAQKGWNLTTQNQLMVLAALRNP